jgi:hypothetical protein
LTPSSKIKKAYLRKSVQMHPDKNPGDIGAEGRFIKMQEAYEIIKTSDKRKVYDCFGMSFLRDPRYLSNLHDPVHLFFHHVMFYAVVGFYNFILGSSTPSRQAARQWSFLGLLALLLLELAMCHAEFDPLVFLFPTVTPFEKITLLRKSYFYLAQGAVMVSELFYVDVKKLEMDLLVKVSQQNATILNILASEPWKVGANSSSIVKDARPPNWREMLENYSKREEVLKAQLEKEKAAGGAGWGQIIAFGILFMQLYGSWS